MGLTLSEISLLNPHLLFLVSIFGDRTELLLEETRHKTHKKVQVWCRDFVFDE